MASCLPWSAPVCLSDLPLSASSQQSYLCDPHVLRISTSYLLVLCLCFSLDSGSLRTPTRSHYISGNPTYPSVLTQLSCEILKWCPSALYYAFSPPLDSRLLAVFLCVWLATMCKRKRRDLVDQISHKTLLNLEIISLKHFLWGPCFHG